MSIMSTMSTMHRKPNLINPQLLCAPKEESKVNKIVENITTDIKHTFFTKDVIQNIKFLISDRA